MNILIADHHPIVVMALCSLLTDRKRRIRTVHHADAMLDLLGRGAPHLIVLDIDLPGRLRGAALLEAIVAARPRAGVIVFSGATQPCLMGAALQAGVHAWVSKTSPPERLLEAVRQVAQGGRFFDPAVDFEAAKSHPWQRLTLSERDVVLRLARGERMRAIAAASGRSYKTVCAHKYSALGKLGLRVTAEIGAYVERIGLG